MNPVLSALGHLPDARLLVVHLDDVGMNAGANSAWEAVHRAGTVSSASVMMPCPAAQAALGMWDRLAEEGTEPDVGVHLTVTCEWESYRWGALNPQLGLILNQSDGGMPRTAEEHGRLVTSRESVYWELRHQIDAARGNGRDLTHIDSHMFALLYPPRLEVYMQLALEYRLPCMLPGTVDAWRPWCGDDGEAADLTAAVEPVRTAGMPLFDRVCGVPLENPPEDRPAAVRQLVRDSVPGLNFLFLHANEATDEVKGFADDWPARQGDMDVFSDPDLRLFIEDEGIVLVGMRELREVWRRETDSRL